MRGARIIRRVAHGGSRQKRSSSGGQSTRGRGWQTPQGTRGGKQPRTRGAGSKRMPKKRGGERSEPQTALPQRGGEPTPTSRARGGRAEWETGRRALVGAKPRDQPPTGAKAPPKGARGERSTANGGAYEQMIRLSPTTMLGARARAYATRKRGSHRHKAVAGGAGRTLRPKGRG